VSWAPGRDDGLFGDDGGGAEIKVQGILNSKGHDVHTIRPDALVTMVVHRLTSLGIGALVVSADGTTLEGVVSERDIVRGLTKHGPRLLDMTAMDVMNRHVPTCSPDDNVKAVMAQMTRTRNRHLPVVQGGALAGLVSIGDIVKSRLEELELETNVLRDSYIARH
jgi:CBS domain-containing protein